MRLKTTCEAKGIKFTVLKPKLSFDHYAFEKIVHKRDGTIGHGYSWCGGTCRWGTSLKTNTLDNYCKHAIVYVGIAADETKRLGKLAPNKQAPLAEWHITEQQALNYCYNHGFYFTETMIDNGSKSTYRLYDLLDRVSCWCCANKNLKELYNMYKYLPNYWAKLKEYQVRTNRPYRRDGKNIVDLEKQFKQKRGKYKRHA